MKHEAREKPHKFPLGAQLSSGLSVDTLGTNPNRELFVWPVVKIQDN